MHLNRIKKGDIMRLLLIVIMIAGGLYFSTLKEPPVGDEFRLTINYEPPLVVSHRTPDGDTLKAFFLAGNGDTLAVLTIAKDVFIFH